MKSYTSLILSIVFFLCCGSFIQAQPTSYSNTASYNVGDLVVSGSATYIAIVENSGQTPPNTTFWTDLSVAAAALNIPVELVPSIDITTILGSLPNAAPDANSTGINSSSGTIRIFSISTRSFFGSNGMSASLNMAGSSNEAKKVMFRVKGPSMNLNAARLANPYIDVKSKEVGTSSWTDEFVSFDFGDHASATGPYKERNTGNALEPMVVTSITPKTYGCVVGAEGGGSGNAIVEIYSLDDDTSSSYFTSLSTRGYFSSNGMSGSVRLVGSGSMKVMFRVKGPSMNIGGTKLSDPNISIKKKVDTGWEDILKSSTFGSPYTQENANYTNLTSSYTDRHTGNNLEPMVVLELSEGTYGCVVGSDNGGQGNAILEIYSID